MSGRFLITAFVWTIAGITLAGGAMAQKISGFIFETEGNGRRLPLAGVNVYWAGTTAGTFTDGEGRFRIARQKGSTDRLVLSLLGYRKDTINAGNLQGELEHELTPDKMQLSEVVITGKQEGSFISTMKTQYTQVITPTELKRAACCNLSESFETNASVDVSYSDAISGARQIQLLGLSGIYSQIMTENIPLVRGLATPYGLSYIPGPWMESIQVAKGTSSVVQGNESITGQINVEYKKPETSERLYLNVFGNSNLRFEANADAAVKIGEKLSTSLLVHGADFRHRFDRNKDGFMDLPLTTTLTAMNRWDYIVPGKWVSRFGVKFLYDERNGGQMDFDRGSFSFDTAGISDGTKRYGIGVRTDRLEIFWKNGIFLGKEGHSSLGLILAGINHRQDGFYGINRYHGHEQYLNAGLIFTWHDHNERNKISAGGSFLIDDYSESFQQHLLTYRYQLLPDTVAPSGQDLYTLIGDSLSVMILDRSEQVSGAFFEYTFDIRDKFSVIAGIRGDYSTLYGFMFTPRLHLRVTPFKGFTVRGSAGKGYRSPNLLAENSAVFVSQRRLVLAAGLSNEEAWNYGINITWGFKLFNHTAELSLDAYRTYFVRQVVVDQDSLPEDVFFYNLNGKSYAGSVQAQLIFVPYHCLRVTAAFRYNDARVTEGGVLRKKAMVNAFKGLLSLSYATRFDKWRFDLTGQLNGPARLPDMEKVPGGLQRAEYSPTWFNLLGQVTRKFKRFEIYVGGENLTGYRQTDPIAEYSHPYHTWFDGSMVWGPVTGITIYAGVRLTIQ